MVIGKIIIPSMLWYVWLKSGKDFRRKRLMGLSKAFDTINHELLIAKLHAYGFEKSVLKLLLNYVWNRRQCTKITRKFSSWVESTQGVLKGSVLGLLLFNIYLYDLFLLVEFTKICNFAGDTTLSLID